MEQTSDSLGLAPPTPALPRQGAVRRDLLRTLFTSGFLLWVGAFIYPVFRYLKPRVGEDTADAVQSIIAGKVADFDTTRAKLVKFGTRPILVLKNDQGEIVAMAATCTHLGCTVQYVPEKNHIFCACHGGTYDLTGRNIAGPPPAPLHRFKVVTNGEDIVVSRS